jgi:hypothetical protein
MIRSAALAVTLVLGLAIAWLASQTPPAAPSTTVKTAFSAERAIVDVREVGRAAHPLESSDHARVRDYVADRLRRLGLEVRTQRTSVIVPEGPRAVAGGEVENVIGVLHGRDASAKAVVVEAHYDSAPNSPGSADDGAGVASALETARALVAEGQPLRDVVFVITDGEENGLLGARAFWEQDLLAQHAGFVLNMDTRGGGGRTFMFETGHGNGQTIDLFHRTSARPASNSLAIFLYEHMPNGTDFTVPKDLGLQGLNFAFIGRPFDYHAASSTPEALDIGSLQHMGEQVHGAARALAFGPTLPAKAADVVYADVFGAFLLVYAPVVGWVLVALCAGLIGFVLMRAWRRGELSPVETARGAAGGLSLLLFGALLMQVARGATGIPMGFAEQRPLLAQFGLYELALGALGLGVTLVGFAAFARPKARFWAAGSTLVVTLLAYLLTHSLILSGVGAVAAVLALFAFTRPIRPWSIVAGFLLVGLILAAVSQALAPATGFLFAWPLLAAVSSALAVSLIGGFGRPTALLTSGLIAAVALGWLLAQAHGVALGVGADIPAALTVFVWLCALVLVPVIAAEPRPMPLGAAALVVGAGLVAWLGLHDPSSARFPRATQVLYVRDDETGHAYRAALTPTVDSWTKQALQAEGGAIRRQPLPTLAFKPAWVTDALAIDAPRTPPRLASGPDGVTIALPPGAWVQLDIRTRGRAASLSVEGRSVPLRVKPGTPLYVFWHTPRDAGAGPTTLMLSPAGPMDVRYAVINAGWPTAVGPPPKRPANAMPWYLSDSTAEVGVAQINP